MKHVLFSLALVGALAVTGCGTKELGPVDEGDVKQEDPAVIQQGMQESLKHVPKNVQVPSGVLPPGASPGGN